MTNVRSDTGPGGPTPEGPAMRSRFENDYRKSLNLLRKLLFLKRKKVSSGGLTSAPDHIFSHRRVRTRAPGGVGWEQPVRAAPIPMRGTFCLYGIPSSRCVIVKHLHCIERIIVEIVANKRKLLQDVISNGDNMTSDRVCMKNIQKFPWTGPDQL